jgi:hypothetical protein
VLREHPTFCGFVINRNFNACASPRVSRRSRAAVLAGELKVGQCVLGWPTTRIIDHALTICALRGDAAT